MNKPKDADRAPVNSVVHTPGPWIVKDDDQYDHVFTQATPHRRIANVYGGVKGTNDLDLQNQANARLIAAAPDLLEACRVAFNACQNNLKMYQYKNEQLLHDAFKACEAAIEKATS